VFGSGYGRVAFLVVPENSIQPSGSGGIGAGEIHFRRLTCAARVALVGFVDQAVFQVAIIGIKSGLPS